MSEARLAAVAFEGVNPILRVEDINAAVDHYTRVLGFKLDWQGPGSVRSVSRGRCHLFLCQGDQGHPGTWVWIGVEDADALLEEYRRTERRSGTSQRTIPGPAKCRSKISTAMCCALDPSKENEPLPRMAGHAWPALDSPARGRL